MTTKIQKSDERHFVKMAAKDLGEEWEIENFEAPDFIVTTSEGEFGLEVCQIFAGRQDKRGSAFKKGEAENQKRINEARRKYEAQQNVPLQVKLLGDVCPENLNRAVEHLCAMNLSKNLLSDEEQFDVIPCPSRKRLKAFVRRLPEDYSHGKWYRINDRIGWVGGAFGPIDEMIQRKSEELSRYKENTGLDDIRLLIVADHLRESGMLKLPDCREFEPRGFRGVYFLPYPEPAVALSLST